MARKIVINFKGKDFVIAPKTNVLRSGDFLDSLSMSERLAALHRYTYLSPLSTLKSVQQKIDILLECEIIAYTHCKTKLEYLCILRHYFSNIFPEVYFQMNDADQTYVMDFPESRLYTALKNFFKFLETLNGFDLLKANSGFMDIISKTKRREYSNVQEFTNDMQRILMHLKNSKVRKTSAAAVSMLEEYATYFDPIFQHIGYCCSGSVEEEEEHVYSCMICQRLFHDFCENYFPPVDGNDFICRLCKHRNEIDSFKISLKELPHYEITKIMERNVKKLLNAAKIQIENVNIRLVFNDRKKFKVHPTLVEHLKYPSKLYYQEKVFVAFQKVEGNETLLFYLNVHEYNDDSVKANRRCVNIAYIDSVQYFSPADKNLRRSIYYEIIQSYMASVKEMGFLKAYIWIAPPNNLQDYVFNQHKIPYRPPTRSSLKKFYCEMLEQARKKKIIHKFTSIEKSNPFCNEKYKLEDIPYFYGDFWFLEVERHWNEYEKRNARQPFPLQLLKNFKDSMHDPINSDLMIVVDLTTPKERLKASKVSIDDVNSTIKCDIIADREEFLIYQRSHGYSFKTIQHAHLSTKRLCYEIKKDYKLIKH